MPPSDPTETLAVIRVLAERLTALGIGYYIGGSVASSVHGIFRATNDIDLVVDLSEDRVDSLVAALQDDFYIDADMIRDALQHQMSFNVIYLPTMTKADLFPRRRTPFGASEWTRRRAERIWDNGSSAEATNTAGSAEDMIVQKLDWYRITGERSDRQWGDVQGMLKVQGEALDFAYLHRWAAELGLTDLLKNALEDAGLADENGKGT